MNESDFAPDQATHEDIVTVPNSSCHREDLVAFRMRPPAAPNGLSNNHLGERRDWPVRRLEYDAVLANESESLA